MDNKWLLAPLLAGVMSTALMAAELPSEGAVELGFSGSLEENDYGDYLSLHAEAAWFVTDRQQVGGGFLYGHSEDGDGYEESDAYGVNVVYRYNFIDPGRSFFPYLGARLSYRKIDTTFEYDDIFGEVSIRTEDEQTSAELHGGIKFMLNSHVAWDNGFSYWKQVDGREDDWWVLKTGLSVFF